MQRQSLGSPGRERLVISSDDAVLISDDHKRRESSPSSFSAADLSASAATDADEIKPEKPHHHRCRTQPEKFIHLIPVLIVFCFVVLYLSSYDPSPQDLAEFRGFHYKQPEDIIEMNGIDEIGRIDEKNGKELKRSEAFVIRSTRNLQEEIVIQRDTPKYQTHRKLGDF